MNKKMKVLREMTEDTLSKTLADTRKEIRTQKAQMNSGNPPKNVGVFKESKRRVARILTILKEKTNKGVQNKKI